MYFRSRDTGITQDKPRKRNMINNNECVCLFSCVSSSEENKMLKCATTFSIVSVNYLCYEFLNEIQDNMNISSSLIRNKVRIKST